MWLEPLSGFDVFWIWTQGSASVGRATAGLTAGTPLAFLGVCFGKDRSHVFDSRIVEPAGEVEKRSASGGDEDKSNPPASPVEFLQKRTKATKIARTGGVTSHN